ncbi:Diaminopimelate epimerase [Labeo rohita]|uniref:Diaminopimelate epimerase n=1 Tax=Labeo rohita TaxID=84645 RepID=A0ABQ8L1I5_LABRO|nr:Diaminopimelate epimerase [Labeo rohita]
MASTSKTFKRCVDPCPRYLTPDDMHNLCIYCLGEEYARDVLEGAACVHCELFSMKKLHSRLSLFSRGEGQLRAPCGSGPSAAEAWRKMSLWGSQADLADELKKGLSLPFHSEIGKVWKMPHSSRIHLFLHSNYANIEGMREYGYERMPSVEEVLASYLSIGKTSSLKTLSLPSILLQVTSRLTLWGRKTRRRATWRRKRRTAHININKRKSAMQCTARSTERLSEYVVTQEKWSETISENEKEYKCLKDR